jgi:uncharacterized protein YecE (DUF72 family)
MSRHIKINIHINTHRSYGAEALEAWAAAIWRWRREGLPATASTSTPPRRVFAFFNNDASMDDRGEPGLPSAVADAHRLGQLLARRLESDGAKGPGAMTGVGLKQERL